jgi:hypothetical protein
MTVKYVSKIIDPSCQCRALVFRVTDRVSFRQDTKITKSMRSPRQGDVWRHEWQQQVHLSLPYHRLYLICMHISPIQSFWPICLTNCKHLRRAELAKCFLPLCTGDTHTLLAGGWIYIYTYIYTYIYIYIYIYIIHAHTHTSLSKPQAPSLCEGVA